MGWRIRGSLTSPLAADGGEKCRTIYVCVSFLRASVVLVVSIIILIHFVVVIFSLRMYVRKTPMIKAIVLLEGHDHCVEIVGVMKTVNFAEDEQ